jgi:hypothetical protein
MHSYYNFFIGSTHNYSLLCMLKAAALPDFISAAHPSAPLNSFIIPKWNKDAIERRLHSSVYIGCGIA